MGLFNFYSGFPFKLCLSLQKYNVKTVRDWCLDEMEIISKKRIRSLVMQQLLASSSSESEDDEEEIKKVNKKKFSHQFLYIDLC